MRCQAKILRRVLRFSNVGAYTCNYQTVRSKACVHANMPRDPQNGKCFLRQLVLPGSQRNDGDLCDLFSESHLEMLPAGSSVIKITT